MFSKLLYSFLQTKIQKECKFNYQKSNKTVKFDCQNNQNFLTKATFSTKLKTPFQSSTKFTVKRADTSLSGMLDFFTVYDFYIWFGIFVVFIIFSLMAIFIFKTEERIFPHRNLNLLNVSFLVLK